MDTGPERGREVARGRSRSARRSRRAGRRPGRREDRREHAPARVDHRAARVARAAPVPRSGDRAALDRPAAVGVLGEDRARRADARRRARRTGRSRGKPRIAPAPPDARVGGERQRAPAEPGDAQDGDVVARVEGDAVRGAARSPSPPSWTVVSLWPATTCALVTTMPSRRDPARALDAEAAGRALDLHDAVARRRAPAGRGRSPRAARATPAAGRRCAGTGRSAPAR